MWLYKKKEGVVKLYHTYLCKCICIYIYIYIYIYVCMYIFKASDSRILGCYTESLSIEFPNFQSNVLL